MGLANALQLAGASGKRRNRVIRQTIQTAGTQVELQDLRMERQQLQLDIKELENRDHHISRTLKHAQAQAHRLQEETQTMQQRHQQLERDYAAKSSDLEVLQAFRTFLLGKTEDSYAFFAEVEAISQWRQAGGTLTDAIGVHWTQSLREKIYKFFQALPMEGPSHLRQPMVAKRS